jgi:hypothetical protein
MNGGQLGYWFWKESAEPFGSVVLLGVDWGRVVISCMFNRERGTKYCMLYWYACIHALAVCSQYMKAEMQAHVGI